jgi:Protein of unknown function (DUF4238)
MGHHYVPRKYLAGFCEPDSDKFLWLYDKQKDGFSRASTKQVAQERGYYSDEVEEELARTIELPANIVIEKLRQGQPIDGDDRNRLAVYIATMIKRVPDARQRATALIPTVLSEVVEGVKALVTRAASEGKISPELEARRMAEIASAQEKIQEETPAAVIDQIRTPRPAPAHVQAILEMTWRFISTSGPSYFLTSDNPAYFFSSFGLGQEQAELVMPIASDLALHACWTTTRHEGVVPVRQPLVKEINKRVASGATRFIFYRQQADWIRSIAHLRQQDLNRLRWDW